MSAIDVRQSSEFAHWLHQLRAERAKARIGSRIRRFEHGNPGDTRFLAGGLGEMRIDYGPGYRVYFTHRGMSIVLLLCGGDKRSQQRDVAKARLLLEKLDG